MSYDASSIESFIDEKVHQKSVERERRNEMRDLWEPRREMVRTMFSAVVKGLVKNGITAWCTLMNGDEVKLEVSEAGSSGKVGPGKSDISFKCDFVSERVERTSNRSLTETYTSVYSVTLEAVEYELRKFLGAIL